jgi:hypothetical protein
LWNYVQHKSGDYHSQVASDEIRARITATAEQEERCAITGKTIRSGDAMLLGFTTDGNWVPLSKGCLV